MERNPGAERKAVDAALARLRHALRYAPKAEREDIVFHAREQLEAAAEEGGLPALEAEIANMDLDGYAAQYPVKQGVGRWLAFAAWLLMGVVGLLAVSGMLLLSGTSPVAVAILWLTAIGAWVMVAIAMAAGIPLSIGTRIRIAVFIVAGLAMTGWVMDTAVIPNSQSTRNSRGGSGSGGMNSNQRLATPIVDNLDLPFEPDPALVGEWRVIGFTRSPAQFLAEGSRWQGEMYLQWISVGEGGHSTWRLPNTTMEIGWTHHAFLDARKKTASRYFIQSKGGKTYLFVEWKSGDYTLRGMTPGYYVLERE